jgi:hypothetical protein
MSQKSAPRISKIPFIISDIVSIGVAVAIIYQSKLPIAGAQILAIVACVAVGAWVCVLPFLRDHDADMRFAEADRLADTVAQINQLKVLASQIQGATVQWQTFQENSEQATAAMRGMAGQLTTDAQNFAEAMKQSSDAEKAALRLEVEKLKRGEGEWLAILVGLLDHVFALYQAGVRSGQQNVIQQLGGFQAACRDLVRRVGLVAIEAQPGETFNRSAHRMPDENQSVPDGAVIEGTLATGFSFQGRLVRPVLVALKTQRDGDGPVTEMEDAFAIKTTNDNPDDRSASAEFDEDEFETDPDQPDGQTPIA